MKEKIFQQEQGCDIAYKDLSKGTIYATIYPEQGWYIFKEGESSTWWNAGQITKGTDNFVPGNGFHLFRLATLEEIYKLKNIKLENYEIY